MDQNNELSPVLAIDVNGSVFRYEFRSDYNSSLNYQEHRTDLTPIVDENTIITCLGILDIDKTLQVNQIQFYPFRRILIIPRVKINNIDSIAVYEITDFSLNLLFSDSLLGVSALTYIEALDKLASIGRGSNILQLFDIPRGKGRFIQNIEFIQLTNGESHIIAGPTDSQFKFLTYNDSIKPQFTIFSFERDAVIRRTYQLMIPSAIESAAIFPSNPSIGLTIRDDKSLISSIWDLSDGLVQDNIRLPDYEECFGSRVIFFGYRVYGLKAFYSHTKNKFDITQAQEGGMEFFTRYGDTNFYEFSPSLGLGVRLRAKMDASPTSVEKIPYISCLSLIARHKRIQACGVHLYRCDCCGRPLLTPLKCKVEGFKCRYCSTDCHDDHFPMFYYVMHPEDVLHKPNDAGLITDAGGEGYESEEEEYDFDEGPDIEGQDPLNLLID